MNGTTSEVTGYLLAWADGDSEALGRLMPLVMDDLRRIARRYMGNERRDHTLQPTALINELYMRLLQQRHVTWRNRAHFYGTAADIMYRILVDHARLRQAKKRGEGEKPFPLDELLDHTDEKDRELIALADALEDLERIHRRQSRVVKMHYFIGLTYEEIAGDLGVSSDTVKRDLRLARIWLRDQLHSDSSRVRSREKSSAKDEDDDGNPTTT